MNRKGLAIATMAQIPQWRKDAAIGTVPAILVAATTMYWSHDYYYFTTIHLTAILALSVLTPLMPSPPMAAAAVVTAINLSFLTGFWVTAYLVCEPCALRVASHLYGDNPSYVAVGHTVEHAVLGAILLLSTPESVDLKPTISTTLLPISSFIVYSSYARPCQIYPLQHPETKVVLAGAVGLLLYLGMQLWWAVRYRASTRLLPNDS